VGVLLGFLIGSSRLAYAAMYPLMTGLQRAAQGGLRADPGGVVRHRRGAGGAHRVPDQFFPIMVNIATGLATLEPELEDVLRVLGAKRWDVLVKVGLPRSMPYFFGSLKVAITLAFVGTTVSEMTLPTMPLAFAGLVTIGAMAMAMYELFSWIEKRTTGWAHRGSQAA
jgi:NitT/TauT family transport system permease protein